MPGLTTEITEIATALGTLSPNLDAGLAARAPELRNVPDEAWARLVGAREDEGHAVAFDTAFANGAALLAAADGLRGRPPRLVEWKGPHRPPGDDVVPADLRIDHVYLVSCKYLSRVLLNAGPDRLFDRLLIGEGRASHNWFGVVAPREYLDFYDAARAWAGQLGLPGDPSRLTASQQRGLRVALGQRALPTELQPAWAALCERVSTESAARWHRALASPASRLRLLWRLLRVGNATYFVLGSDRSTHLRLRVASTWDWSQAFELVSFATHSRLAGQPEVAWEGVVRARADGRVHQVAGHVEIRWSHGRFVGWPEAKVYLDTPHASVPGYVGLE